MLLAWINQYPDRPVKRINYEYLNDAPDMALSTIQAAYKTQQYITGEYEAQYQFKVIYRIRPGDSNDERLKADELLNGLADWAVAREDKPIIGPGRTAQKIESNTRSTLFARYEDGTEDHQILMTMAYEVDG